MPDYNPREKTATLLRQALEIVQSVPYEVTTRWTFYRMSQIHGYPNKKKAYAHFKAMTSKARHSFWEGWAPDTLADDSRGIVEMEDGFDNVGDWLRAVGEQKPQYPAVEDQKCIFELWFEAAAMRRQFEYYTSEYRIDLVPFGGDPSLKHKWNAARRVADLYNKYKLPIVILYFGDFDPHGLQIPESALKHIWKWTGELDGIDTKLTKINNNEWKTSDGKFRYIRVGINAEHIGHMNIAENPEKLGTYQWEALNDEQAGEFILDAIKPFWSKELLKITEEKENRVGKKWNAYMKKNYKKILKEMKMNEKEK
jgi:hypothetical protein